MKSQAVIDEKLFQAVQTHDIHAIDELIAQGANPFAPVGCVDMLETGCAWSTRIKKGCAAALCIRYAHVLDRLLPEMMTNWPVVTQAADVFGLINRCGASVDLAHWAVENSAFDSLRLLIKRLDRSSHGAQACLRQLTLSCLGGCSNMASKDKVLDSLVLCMSAEPELGRSWSRWRHARLASQMTDYPDYQPVQMPMTFVMAMMANQKKYHLFSPEESLSAFRWALVHDDPVRQGKCRMGAFSKDSILHMIATCTSLDILSVALESGCSLDALDANHMTPIEFAKKCGKSESAAMMESFLANQAIESLPKLP